MKWHMDTINGHTWHYVHAKLCGILEVTSTVKAWHLFDGDHEYKGNFPTKAAMLTHISKESLVCQ